MSVSTQPDCTPPTVLWKIHKSLTIGQTTCAHFLALFRSFSLSWYHCTLWGSAPPEQAPPQWKSAGYQAIGDWVGFLQSWEWGDGGLWKGIPLEPSLSRTHLSARDTTSLPGPALSVALESGVSKEVHSSPDSEWSHNTQPTGVYDPSLELEDYIVAIQKSTETESTYLNVEDLFCLSSHLLSSTVWLIPLWNMGPSCT